MAVYDDFSGSAGSYLKAPVGSGGTERTTPSGHTWKAQSGYTGVVELTGSGTAFHTGSSGGTQHSIQGAGAEITVDGSAAVLTLDIKSVLESVGVSIRNNAACTECYECIYFSGEWRLYAIKSGARLLAQSGATTPSTGAHTLSIACTGTGASVSILCKLDGAELFGGAVTDTHANRITALGFIGVYSDTIVTSTTGIHLDYIELQDGGGGGGGSSGGPLPITQIINQSAGRASFF